MKNYFHTPVMLEEVIKFLDVKVDGNYIDATLGGGGYTKKITSLLGDDGRALSIDLDPLSLENFSQFKTKKNIVVNDNFVNIKKIVLENFKKQIFFDGIVADLGLSSAQLDDEERGFSFNNEKSLDMAFGPKIENDTFWIVNNYKQFELENIIKEYGEEPWAKKIAGRIVEERKKNKIDNSKKLAEIISSAIPKKFWSKRINPATKTFQALRMETNNELDVLGIFLEDASNLLKVGGCLVVVSFHSLEDRIVKRFFKSKKESGNFELVNKKPLVATENETKNNSRARSAKLRVLKRIK
ncbi:MAG: 16S rRNA (cytosine(1402)-N(4))-methyltransferase RsmH [Patescibacteria group bacterium]|nr:16S rRNA (cytosine(1402)-N(4))-methyltransferase RsmH [Patescibacteria group bacterium]